MFTKLQKQAIIVINNDIYFKWVKYCYSHLKFKFKQSIVFFKKILK